MERTKKKQMTDDERQELARKLDKDLDDLINSLPKRKYEDGWPEDRWEEEMEKHPFFMTKTPQPGADLHPLYEGLQKLKYDPEENEPDELALAYKEDGNFNFKHKNYRIAVVAYTEGIKIKCGKPDIEASLYNNRAAAHFHLENYRSALKDCEFALKLQPDYRKAMVRAAHCCFFLEQYDKALEYCDKLLDEKGGDKEIIALSKKCVAASNVKKRDARKKSKEQKKQKIEAEELLSEIKKRGVTLLEGAVSIEHLEPHFPQLVHHRVSLDEDGNLTWPVVFLYPEYKIMDYIEAFSENHRFEQQIEHVFQTTPEWDDERKYVPERLNVYYENNKKMLVEVQKEKTLGEILSSKDYVVQGGTPSFIILVKDSAAGKGFLSSYNL